MMSLNTDDTDTDTERNIISVWFECKSCQFIFPFRTVAEFLDHKKQKHFEEFQNVRCIVFEERNKQNELFANSDRTSETKLFAQVDEEVDGDVKLSSGCAANEIFAEIAGAASPMKPFPGLSPVSSINLIRSNNAAAPTTLTEALTDKQTEECEFRADFGLYSKRLPSVINSSGIFDLQADLIQNQNDGTHTTCSTQLMHIYLEVENNSPTISSDNFNPDFSFVDEADGKIDADGGEVEAPSNLEDTPIHRNVTSSNPYVLLRRLTSKELEISNHGFNRKTEFKGNNEFHISKTTLITKANQDNHGSFVCTICSKSFTTNCSRIRHMNSHYGFQRGQQLFKCSYSDCPSSFNTKSKLKGHTKRHINANLHPNSVNHKFAFKFPEPDSDTDLNEAADSLTLREWLIEQKACKISNPSQPQTDNVILLEPDPTEMGESEAFTISGQASIKCKLCRKNLESEAEIKVHVTHCWLRNKSRHVYCVPCGKTLNRPRALEYHTKAIHAEQINKPAKRVKPPKRSHKCHICLKEYSKANHLKAHLESHKTKEERERGKSFVCEICGKAFSSKTHLKSHQVTHSQDRRFKCSYQNCTGAFHFNRSLQDHLKTHLPKPQNIPKLFCCPKEGCSKRFTSKRLLRDHLLKTIRHTGLSLPKSVKCDQENCGKLYIHKISLDRHMIAAHGIGGELPTFECEICKKTFTWKISKTLHMRSHSEDRPFKCNYDGCEKAYKDKGTLVEHVHGKHTGERHFQCELCGKAYYRRMALKWHMGVHKKSLKETE